MFKSKGTLDTAVYAPDNAYGAGIGGSAGNDAGTIIINGGRITASGTGCNLRGAGGNVTINGGIVTATSYYGAGIGGGGATGYDKGGAGGSVTINGGLSYYVIASTGDSVTLDTKGYQMSVNGTYQIGVKLTGTKAASVKITSTNDKIATAARLKNGNVLVNGKGVGTAYIMIDVYDSKNHLLTHASVRIDVKTGIRPRGDSTRQIGIF